MYGRDVQLVILKVTNYTLYGRKNMCFIHGALQGIVCVSSK